MITPAMQRDSLLKGIERGLYQSINQAHDLKMLDGLMFDIIRLFNMNTAFLLERAATFGADFKQRDAQQNTLLHALAQSSIHVLNTPNEKHIPIQRDYYLWTIEVLIKHGLSLNELNTAGQTPEALARERKNLGFINALGMLEIKEGMALDNARERLCHII